VAAASPQVHVDDLAQYKKLAGEAQKAIGFGQANMGGLVIGNSSGTTQTYAANSLVTR